VERIRSIKPRRGMKYKIRRQEGKIYMLEISKRTGKVVNVYRIDLVTKTKRR